jgi:dihydrofolate reductase
VQPKISAHRVEDDRGVRSKGKDLASGWDQHPEDETMTATYTWDIFSTLDGYGSYGPDGDWGGYWGKQGPELLAHRLAQFEVDQRMVLGANTFQEFVQMLAEGTVPPEEVDEWGLHMRDLPTTVVSNSLEGPFDWPDASAAKGAAVDVVRQLKADSAVPLRSHGSLQLNWALLAAGLVDRIQVTIFPVISGKTGTDPIFGGAADFDLELLESTTLDRNTQVLVYRPTRHG